MDQTKYVKLSWTDFERDCLELSRKIKDIKVDKIIAISRGGLVASRIFSDLLSLPISHITISSYKDFKQVSEPYITEVPSKTFDDERVLIIDEVSDSGRTFKRALTYFAHFSIKKIYTLSPYIKPDTKFVPDFWLKEIAGWIVFPYDIRETWEVLTLTLSPQEARAKMLQIGFKDWEITNLL